MSVIDPVPEAGGSGVEGLRSRSRQVAFASGQRWLLGGVAAELALCLRASAGFVRLLFVIAASFQFWPVLAAYCLLALVLPHGGRSRPGWSNLVGLLRVSAFLVVGEISFRWVSFGDGVFSQPATIWIPVAGTVALAWIVLLTTRRPVGAIPAATDRRTALSALPPVVVALGLLAIMRLAPEVRADRLLDIALIALGVFGALAARRLSLSAFAAASLPLGLLALLLAGSGATLRGGIGGTTIEPHFSPAVQIYRRAVGDVTLDLSGVHPDNGEHAASFLVNVGIGRVEIDLPSDALTTVRVSIGDGTLNWGYLPPTVDRFMLRRTIVITPQKASGGRALAPKFRLTIDATVGQGCVLLDSISSQGAC